MFCSKGVTLAHSNIFAAPGSIDEDNPPEQVPLACWQKHWGLCAHSNAGILDFATSLASSLSKFAWKADAGVGMFCRISCYKGTDINDFWICLAHRRGRDPLMAVWVTCRKDEDILELHRTDQGLLQFAVGGQFAKGTTEIYDSTAPEKVFVCVCEVQNVKGSLCRVRILSTGPEIELYPTPMKWPRTKRARDAKAQALKRAMANLTARQSSRHSQTGRRHRGRGRGRSRGRGCGRAASSAGRCSDEAARDVARDQAHP